MTNFERRLDNAARAGLGCMDANRADQKLPEHATADDLRVYTRHGRHSGDWVIEYDGRVIFSTKDLYEVCGWLRDFKRFRERTT